MHVLAIRLQLSPRKLLRLDDEVRFIRSWIEKPLSTGAVTPSGKAAGPHHGALCRSRDRPARSSSSAPAPARSPRRWSSTASIRRGSCWSNSIRCSAACCARAIRRRPWCRATPIASSTCWTISCAQPAAAIVSGLPLFTKPLRTRLRLIARRLRPAGAGRALHPVHLCDDAADPEGASGITAAVGPDLAEPAAGPRLGVSPGSSVERLNVSLVMAGLVPAISLIGALPS